MALPFGILAGMMLAFPREAAEAARQGIAVWAQAVVPVLGPFMVCALLITSRLSGSLPLKILCGWLSGSPGGARLLAGEGLRGKAALQGAALSGTMSPMFFLGTVSLWLNDPAAGPLIFFCHLCGAVLTGLIWGPLPKGKKGKAQPLPLGAALRESAQALLTVGLCMALGCAAARMVLCAAPKLPSAAAAALQCALEVTAGVQALIRLKGAHSLPWVCAACSFGGLSLLMQNAAFWEESGVGFMQLLGLRLCHALAAGGLCLAACALLGRG